MGLSLGDIWDGFSAVINPVGTVINAAGKRIAGWMNDDEQKFNASEAEKNRQFQTSERLAAQEFNEEMWNKNNEYNSIIKNAKLAKTQLDTLKVKFTEAKQMLEPQIAKLKAELTLQAKTLDKNILDKYIAKRESKFPVFVRNINGTCGGCRMAISASKMREFNSCEYIECENCGRIITKV